MAIAQATLNSVNLPYVSKNDGYEESVEYRGYQQTLADGSTATELVSTTVKRRFRLSWVALTEDQVTNSSTGVLKAYEGIRAGSAAFVSPINGNHTVNRDGEVEIRWYSTGGTPTLRADVTMRLKEA